MLPGQLPPKRKRGRPSRQKANEPSPLSDVPPLSAAKRRRLDSTQSSPSTPKALQALKSAFGGVFSLVTKQDNTTSPSRFSRLLSNGYNDYEAHEEKENGVGSEDSDEDELGHDEQRGNDAVKRSVAGPLRGGKQQRSRDKHAPEAQPADHGYEIHNLEETDDNDELAHIGGPQTDKQTDNVETPTKKSNRRYGNKISGSIPRNADAVYTGDNEPNAATISQSESRSSARERRKPRRFSNEMVEMTKSAPRGILTPSKGRPAQPKKNVAFEVGDPTQGVIDLGFKDIPTFNERSASSKQLDIKKGSKRALIISARSVDENNSPAPSEVLTEDELDVVDCEERVKFQKKATIGSNKAALGKGESPRPEELDDSDEDDEKCVLCGNGDSEEPNEIILCDKCDRAYHQACHNVFPVPKGEWICRECQSEAGEKKASSGQILDDPLEIDRLDYHLSIMQRIVLDKLTGRRRLTLQGHGDEYAKVHQVVEQTVLAGEGNSMLIIGARGSGKTTLVETVIRELLEDHREDFHVIRLSGFIHTDDKLALREIWRQLGREMEVEDELVSKTNNYADTLASLLALLSHPSEIIEVEENRTAKSVIFILDEFDLFASHPRQTLLYNLFDIAQARKAPIAVLGVTTKIDVVETLEKRVKSRFSHRYVHLPLPKTLSAFKELCKQGLVVDMNEIVEQGFDPGVEGQEEFLAYWDLMIDKLCTQDPSFHQLLASQYMYSKSIPAVFTSCIIPIATLTSDKLPLTGSSFIPEDYDPCLMPPDSKLHLLENLSELDLAMLISAARFDIIMDTDTCNFAMAYDEYSSLTSKHKIQTSSSGVTALGSSAKVWGREVAMGSWERLADCELLVPAGLGGLGAGPRDVGREGRMWKVDVGLNEIPDSVELNAVMRKWCRID